MAIITAKTAATVLPLYGNFIDKHLRDASWFIAKVRLSLSVNAKQTSLDQTTGYSKFLIHMHKHKHKFGGFDFRGRPNI